LDELLALKPDYVAESASVETIRSIAIPVLSTGAQLIALSCGAFADKAFLEQVQECARAHNTKVHIPSGAIGGFDVMQTITLMAQAGALPKTAVFNGRKGPGGMRGTSLYREELENEETEVFAGSASGAIALMPTKVNVAVATSLATLGPDNTEVHVTTEPGFKGDEFFIRVETEGYYTTLNIYSETSGIAGWSVVAALRNLSAPISFH
jgi:aspartate dehydrogenase